MASLLLTLVMCLSLLSSEVVVAICLILTHSQNSYWVVVWEKMKDCCKKSPQYSSIKSSLTAPEEATINYSKKKPAKCK